MPAKKNATDIQISVGLATPLKHESIWYSVIMEMVIMLMCVSGCILLFVKALSINLSIYAIVSMIVFPMLLVLVHHSGRIKPFLILGLLVFLGWSIYEYYESLTFINTNAVVYLNAHFLTALNRRYNAGILFYDPHFPQMMRIAAEKVIVNSLALLLSMFFGWVIVKRKNPLVLGSILVIFVFIGIYLPMEVSLLTLFVVLCGFIFYYITWSMTAEKANKAVLGGRSIIMVQTMVLPILLAVALVVGIYIPKNLPEHNKAYYLMDTIIEIANGQDIRELLGKNNTAGGGMGDGRIGTIDKLVFRNQVHLTVESNTMVPMFLKAMASEQYISNVGWTQEPDPISDEFTILFRAMSMKGITSDMFSEQLNSIGLLEEGSELSEINMLDSSINRLRVTNIAASENYRYTPYNLTEVPINTKMLKGTTVGYETFLYNDSVNGVRQVVQSLYDLSIPGREKVEKITSAWSGDLEIKYEQYAKSAYTKVPNDIKETIAKFALRAQEKYEAAQSIQSSDDHLDYALAVKSVSQVLSETAVYSLSPGSVPRGEEPIAFFLNENKKGYCAHFATAATLILREMGIPTRYVEGYVVTKNDYANAEKNETNVVEIRDTNAHSWIEIYEAGPGWIPCEVTPGYSGDSIQSKNLGGVANKSPTSSVQQQSSEEMQSSSTVVSQPNESSSEAAMSSDVVVTEPKENAILWVIPIGFAIMLVAAVLIRRKIILLRQKRRLTTRGNNQAVVELFEYCTRLLAVKGYNLDEHSYAQAYATFVEQECAFVEKGTLERVTEIVLKARFSEHNITEDELETVKALSVSLHTAIYAESNIWKQLILRYFKVL